MSPMLFCQHFKKRTDIERFFRQLFIDLYYDYHHRQQTMNFKTTVPMLIFMIMMMSTSTVTASSSTLSHHYPALLTDSTMSFLIDNNNNHSSFAQTNSEIFNSTAESANDSNDSNIQQNNANSPDYIDLLHYLNNQYRKVHGELSFSVCVFGVITNILNIIVLSRKNMISPTNAILTGMAVSDCAVIASYIPFLGAYYLRPASADQYTFGWAVFTLCHAHITVVFHTISIWLTVLLAIWRYLTVRSAGNSRWYCSMTRAKIAIVLTYAIVPVFCIPVFLCFTIYPYQQSTGSGANTTNITLYKVDMVQTHGELLANINFWAFSVFLKLIPCILLTCLSLALIRILIEARKRKERLLGGNAKPQPLNHSQNAHNHQQNNNHHHHHHHHHNSNNNNNNNNNNTHHNPSHNHHHHRASAAFQTSNQTTVITTNFPLTGSPASGSITDRRSLHGADDTGPGLAANQLYLEIAESNPTNSNVSACNKPQSLLSRILALFHYPIGLFSSDPDRSTNGDRIQLKLRKSRSGMGSHHHNPHHHHHHPHHHHHHHHPSPVPQPPSTRQQASSSGNSERTTRMLIAVLIVFLVCEFPSGVLALLSAINGKAFFDNIYFNFGEMMDMLALINSAVNFILYCFMSQQFRKTFSQLFCICWWTEEVAGPGVGGPISGYVGGGAVRDLPGGNVSNLPGNVNTKVLNINRTVVTSASALPVNGNGNDSNLTKSSSQQNYIGVVGGQTTTTTTTTMMPRIQSDLNPVTVAFASSSTDDDPLKQTDSLTASGTDRESVSETSSIHLNNNSLVQPPTSNNNSISNVNSSTVPSPNSASKNQPSATPSGVTVNSKSYDNDNTNSNSAVQV